MTGNKTANPWIKSADVLTYSLVHEIVYKDPVSGYGKSHVCRIDIDDYRGQETSQILGSWNPTPPESASFSCTSIIFMVDLFKEPPYAGEGQRPKVNWEDSRVKQHVKQWPDSLVRSIVAMARGGNLKYICLFVNKIDLLRVFPDDKQREILTQFYEIDEALRSVSAGTLYERKIGSADKHIGVSHILNKLIEVSVPSAPGP